MSRVIHLFDPPERFVAGTVGVPGQRTFFLQARSGNRVTSVALEKGQVELLAERIDDLLDELMRTPGGETIPAVALVGSDDLDPLDLPVDEEFRVGALGIGWDIEEERLVIEAHAPSDDEDVPEIDDDDADGPDVLRVRM